jgi:VWFA-related protein
MRNGSRLAQSRWLRSIVAGSGLTGAVVVLAASAANQQTPPTQTFRTGITAVELDVSVLDNNRRPVRGLTLADFTILDDGKPRDIASFSAVDLPPVPAEPPSGVDAIEPDVQRNDTTAGRVVIILLDPLIERIAVPGRVSIADPPGITALRVTASRIVDSLAPGDLAGVAHTFGSGAPQNLTTDRARLRRAIETNELGTKVRATNELPTGDCQCGLCRLEAITRIANALGADHHRRKSIFFIGERIRLSPTAGPCNSYLEPATRRMLEATQLANVTVHAVDPNGMETTNVHAGDTFSGAPIPVSESAKEQEEANRRFLIERHQSLQTLADATGGRAVLNTNAPDASVRPILDELSSYYLIAFEAPDARPDGRFHSITVKVNRPGLEVRTRKGYYAQPITRTDTGAEPTVTLEAAAQAMLPAAALPMTITAAPFRSASGKAALVVVSGVGAAQAQPSDGTASSAPEPIEVLTTAFDKDGKSTAPLRQRFSVTLPDATPGRVRYETAGTLTVQPGAYEVRVATRHQRADLLGSVTTYVDVPDFEHRPVSLSGVVLVDRTAPTATPTEALAGILDITPTTRREFSPTDHVTGFARVYEPAGATPAAATVICRILDRNLREITATDITLPAEQLGTAAGADVTCALPLDRLEAGDYLLRVDAVRGGAAARGDVRFSVRK